MADHPLSDHAAHIRLTSLTMLVLCAGLLVALRDPYILRVQTDLDHFEAISRHLEPYNREIFANNSFKAGGGPFLLTDLVAQALPPSPVIAVAGEGGGTLEPRTSVVIDVGEASNKGGVTLQLDHELPSAIIIHDDQGYSEMSRPGVIPPCGIDRTGIKTDVWEKHRANPTRLDECRDFWNVLDKIEIYVAERESWSLEVYRLAPGNDPASTAPLRPSRALDPDGPLGLFKFQQVAARTQKGDGAHLRLRPAPIPARNISGRHDWQNISRGYFAVFRIDTSHGVQDVSSRASATHPAGEAQVGDYVIVRDIRFKRGDPRFQEELLKAVFHGRREATGISLGQFDHSFPDLNEYVSELGGNVDLASLRRFVDRDAARGNTPLEFAGIKIHASAISTWGLAILIAVELYGLAHFWEFLRRVRSGQGLPEIAWVGLYRGWFPTSLVFLAIVAVPAITAGLTMYIGSRLEQGSRWHVGLGVAAILLALSAIVPLVQLKRHPALAVG